MQPDPTSPAAHLATVEFYRPAAQLIPSRWTEGNLTANGIRQHYWRTGGEKPPLVLVHGILAGGITWLRVAGALERDFDVIMPDARGHGRSDGIASGVSYDLLVDDLVDDLAALIHTLDLDRPILLGHSMGGCTSALLAAKHPELVRAILLEDAVWGDTSHLPRIGASEQYHAWLAAYTGYLEALKTQTHAQRMVAALPHLPPGPTGLWPEEEYVPWVEAQAQLDLELVRRGPSLWSSLRPTTPLSDVARDIACPVLLMVGSPRRGSNVNPADVATVLAGAPKAEHVAFEDAGHLIHLDAFTRYIAVVGDFLARHASQ
jgi:pimeloyl-ACP methyl ester carboxylesterase